MKLFKTRHIVPILLAAVLVVDRMLYAEKHHAHTLVALVQGAL